MVICRNLYPPTDFADEAVTSSIEAHQRRRLVGVLIRGLHPFESVFMGLIQEIVHVLGEIAFQGMGFEDCHFISAYMSPAPFTNSPVAI